MEYEAVIGLEVHVQLKTQTKMFSRAPYHFGGEPNTLTDPVVLGLPGALPVMNLAAIRQCTRMGLLFGCKIAQRCKWDRKHYFYPDNPKNYQISQYDQPLCTGGEVEIEVVGPARNIMGPHRKIALTRIHLEEDPAKLNHAGGHSLVDYNRSSVPLAELVTEPVLCSADECVAFLNALRVNLANAGISDCDMEKGQMRCDANVSLRPRGQTAFGIRTETKNLNSVSAVKAAVEKQIKIQAKRLDNGATIDQETLRFDMETQTFTVLRSKEDAHDYRYFPDPDLMPVELTADQLDAWRRDLPELVFDKQRRYIETMQLPYTITSVICHDKGLSDYFEAALAVNAKNPKGVANFIINDLLRELSAAALEGSQAIADSKVTPAAVAELVELTDTGVITKQNAKAAFVELFKNGGHPKAVAETMGFLGGATDTGELEALCMESMRQNAKAVQQFKDGNEKAINSLKGPIMKATKGKANPQQVDEILRKLILENA